MSRLHAEASSNIDAPAQRVYAIISDYRNSHPRILPASNFRDLKIEQGGQGAGTVFSLTSVAGATQRKLRMEVSEPGPGRVLVEKDLASSLVTTFTVTPVDNGARSRVTIATEWDAAPGLKGLIERIFFPMGLRSVYRKELAQLAAVALEGGSAGAD